jgi:DNA-binding MarR family transcriptional regulator
MPTTVQPPSIESADLPDVLDFMQLLWALVHRMERRSKRMNRDLGVTGPQRLVLRIVGLFPDVSAGRLAAILHVHPSTLTGVLHRLVAQRLLQRRNDPADARRALFQLTPRGQLVNKARGETIEAAVAAALRAASAVERSATRRLLERIASHLD